MPNEVYPGIFLIREKGSIEAIKPTENIYILAGVDGLIFDAGYGDKTTIKYLVSEIKEIEKSYAEQNKPFFLARILVSHCHPDHFSGLKRIRENLGVKIVLTRKMFELIKNKEAYNKVFETNDTEDYLIVKRGLWRKALRAIGRKLSDRMYRRFYGIEFIDETDEIIDEYSEILINNEVWKIFPSPGHAIDHISLYNSEKGILFSGDNILSSITTWLGPPNCNITDYVKSVEIIQELPNLKIILAAHGSSITNPKERIEEILKHRKERKQEVLNLINENSAHGMSPSEIIQALYPHGKMLIRGVARGWICLTLKMLEFENLIKRDIGKREILFFPVK